MDINFYHPITAVSIGLIGIPLALFFLYLLSRIISFAVFKSWWEAKFFVSKKEKRRIQRLLNPTKKEGKIV